MKSKCPVCDGNSVKDENGYCECCGNNGYVEDVPVSGATAESMAVGEWKRC